MKKPQWLNKKIDLSQCRQVKTLLRQTGLSTVCEQALCPNIGECFKEKIATLLILGDVCTRQCSFCAIKKGVPLPIDLQEPERVALAIKELGLKYAVITSPTRDDLADGGANMFCRTVEQIKLIDQTIKVEILIPDFSGNLDTLKIIAGSKAEVIAHNIETVPALYIKVRQGADYCRSLKVLAQIKQFNNNIRTKSGFMLGLGETDQQILQVLTDLIKVGCDCLTLGQYLPPSQSHFLLKQYVPPQRFVYWKEQAEQMGFKWVKAGPYVRSSYLAEAVP